MMSKKIHLSIASHDIAASVSDYSARFGQAPDVVVESEYALWKTDTINFSVRCDQKMKAGTLRHLGWQDDSASAFIEERDVNGIIWECFSEQLQNEEISTLWPHAI